MWMFLYITLISFIPSLAWMAVVLVEDVHQERHRDIFSVFLVGMLAAAPVLMVAQLGDVFLESLGVVLPAALDKFIFGALNEELIKVVLLYWFAMTAKFWDEPIDIFVYAGTLALGFAGIENFVLSLNRADFVGQGLEQLLFMRSISAVLVHIVSTFFFAYALKIYQERRQESVLVFGALISIGFHGLYNYSLSIPSLADIEVFEYFYILVLVPTVIYMMSVVRKLRRQSQ